MIQLGLVFGVVTGVAAGARRRPCSGRCSPTTRRGGHAARPGAARRGVVQPLAGVVFVLDGVLIGAGDGRYLAVGGTSVTAGLRARSRCVAVTCDLGAASAWCGCGSRSAWCSSAGRASCCCDRARGDRLDGRGSAASAAHRSLELEGVRLAADRRHGSGDRLPRHPADGYDWVADPIGWVLVLLGLAAVKDGSRNCRGLGITAWVCLAVSVLSWPADSVATLDASLGWLFSLPTIAWCFLMCDALRGRAREGRPAHDAAGAAQSFPARRRAARAGLRRRPGLAHHPRRGARRRRQRHARSICSGPRRREPRTRRARAPKRLPRSARATRPGPPSGLRPTARAPWPPAPKSAAGTAGSAAGTAKSVAGRTADRVVAGQTAPSRSPSGRRRAAAGPEGPRQVRQRVRHRRGRGRRQGTQKA